MSDWAFLNKHRIRRGPLGSDDSYGFNGAFDFAVPGEARRVYCIAADSSHEPEDVPRWEHVSVSFGQSTKTPSWDIMCRVKDLFWAPEDVVIQLHPPQSRWINNHAGCLHLWRCTDLRVPPQPLPPDIFVGIPGLALT